MNEQDEIPGSWQWSTMSDTCEKIQDGTHFSPDQDKQFPQGKYPYVTAKNVRPSGLDLENLTYLEEEDHRSIYERCDPQTGDVLLVKDGVNTGDAAINTVEGEISLLSSVCMLRPRKSVLTGGFLRYYILSPQGYRSLTGQMTGTAIKRIILRKIRVTPLPIAPLNEQGRIVAKIEELFSDLDAGIAALQQTKAKLKRYRGAVLKAAVEGRLTAEWREKHKATEPATKLLERILAERRKRWESEQQAKFTATGKTPQNWREKYTEPTTPDTDSLPELPEGWCWVTVEQLASSLPRSIQSGPFESNLLHTEFQETGVLAIGIDNVLDGTFSMGSQHRISPQKFDELKKYEARPLDVVVTVMATVGRCCVIPADIEPAIITKHVYRISVNQQIADPEFVVLCLSGGPEVRKQIFGEVRGQTRPGINGEILKGVAIPIPPLAEQNAIVSEAQTLLSMVEAARDDIRANLQRATRLRQSILKRAFEGKLVPQNPHDEPASMLLDRIRATRHSTSLEQNGEASNNAGVERTARQVRRSRRANRAAPGRQP